MQNGRGDKKMNTHTTANPFDTGSSELEQLALEECVKRQRIDRRVSVLILPALRCDLSIQFARQGAQVIMADAEEFRHEIEGRILASGQREEIRFVPYTLPALPYDAGAEPYDLIVFQRSLCHLPYPEARQVIRDLMKKLRIGGKLYLSILGLHSALAEGYQDADLDISERYCQLAPELSEKYGIKGPVCLYSERNLFLLLLEAGASVLRTFTTTYGNVKAVAVRV
jgi:SAM-dependent methyltransferase